MGLLGLGAPGGGGRRPVRKPARDSAHIPRCQGVQGSVRATAAGGVLCTDAAGCRGGGRVHATPSSRLQD
ncbi:hypothetical protein HaLaN_33013, partial [Haematococcus lacustris]